MLPSSQELAKQESIMNHVACYLLHALHSLEPDGLWMLSIIQNSK
jgi:hypothetical protein